MIHCRETMQHAQNGVLKTVETNKSSKLQKNEKKLKKGVDKGKVLWYNKQAVARKRVERQAKSAESSLKIEQQAS